MEPLDEMIDVYDCNRVRTGLVVQREGARMAEGQYSLYAFALVQNTEGKYLITQRALDKHWGAGWWETTGGGALAGETTVEAIAREVAEETGLDVSGLTPELLYTYTNVDLKHGDNYFADVFRYRFDFGADDVTLQASEAIDFRLATWDEIAELGAAGTFLHFKRLKEALDANARE